MLTTITRSWALRLVWIGSDLEHHVAGLAPDAVDGARRRHQRPVQPGLRGGNGIVPAGPVGRDRVARAGPSAGRLPAPGHRGLPALVAQIDQRHLAYVGQHGGVGFPAATLQRPAELVVAEQLRPADPGPRAAVVEGAFLRDERRPPGQEVGQARHGRDALAAGRQAFAAAQTYHPVRFVTIPSCLAVTGQHNRAGRWPRTPKVRSRRASPNNGRLSDGETRRRGGILAQDTEPDVVLPRWSGSCSASASISSSVT